MKADTRKRRKLTFNCEMKKNLENNKDKVCEEKKNKLWRYKITELVSEVGIQFNPGSACVCTIWNVCVYARVCFVSSSNPLCLLSNQDLGHEQGSGGGEDQAEPGGPGQTGRSIAEVLVAARLHHGVDSEVGLWKVHIVGHVALSLH